MISTTRPEHQQTLPSTMDDLERRSQLFPEVGFDLPALLAQMAAPLTPLVKRVRYRRHGARGHEPRDILLPEGYAAEVVASGLNAPVQCCFDDAGACYVVEAGHKVESPPRVVKVDTRTGETSVFFEFPAERWIRTGAATGAWWHDGSLYLTNTDTVSRLTPDGALEDLVTGLPGRGDHQVNQPRVGPDGRLYFAVGSVTNSGVVGPDNAAYEWLSEFPDQHDVPALDVTLAGRNFESHDVLGNQAETVHTGAFVPYRTRTGEGQVVQGSP